MKNKIRVWDIFFFIFLISITAFFRLYNLNSAPPGLYPDEAMNGSNALEALSTGNFKVFYPENTGREGLFMNIQALFLKIVGVNEPWVLRLASTFFGIITVLGVYYLVRLVLLSRLARDPLKVRIYAFIPAFFMAVSFWHINFSRIGFRAIMAPAFLVWTIYFLVKSFLTAHEVRFFIPSLLKNPFLWSVITGLVFGLGMHSYIAYRVMPLFLVVAFFICRAFFIIPWKRFWMMVVSSIGGAFISGLPLLLYFIAHPQDFFGRTSQISVFSLPHPLVELFMNCVKTIGMFFVMGDNNWRHNFAGTPELTLFVQLFLIVGVVAGIYSFFRKNRMHGEYDSIRLLFSISCVWIVVAFLPVVISSEGIPHALRSILMIPPIFIISGIGVWFLYMYLREYLSTRVFAIAGISIALCLVVQVYLLYFVAWAHNPNVANEFTAQYVRIGRELRDLPVEIPKYVVVNVWGIDVRGIPVSAQTVMFMTDTFTPEKQALKNIHYILPGQESTVPSDALLFYLRS